jgi:hypothetical protein
MKNYTFLTTVALAEGDGYYWESQNAQVVYDGTGIEDEPNGKILHFGCEVCGQPMEVDIQAAILNGWDSFGKWKAQVSPETLGEFSDKFKLKVEDTEYGVFHRTAMGFTPFVQFVECKSCGEQYLMVLGYGEVQPGRYVGVFQGIRQVDGEGLPEGMNAQ